MIGTEGNRGKCPVSAVDESDAPASDRAMTAGTRSDQSLPRCCVTSARAQRPASVRRKRSRYSSEHATRKPALLTASHICHALHGRQTVATAEGESDHRMRPPAAIAVPLMIPAQWREIWARYQRGGAEIAR